MITDEQKKAATALLDAIDKAVTAALDAELSPRDTSIVVQLYCARRLGGAEPSKRPYRRKAPA